MPDSSLLASLYIACEGPGETENKMGANKMDDLIAGYRRFRAGTWRNERSRFEELSRVGQKPRALVLACSDSRTDPQMVFNSAPGELFVVRNVANLAPPYLPDGEPHGTSAAIEFGVRALKVGHIVVMGHAMCGGIAALINGAPAETLEFVDPWVRIAERALRRVMTVPPGQRHDACERESVRLSLANLLTFPWIETAVQRGDLKLHGCFFDIRSGILECLADDGSFYAIAD